MRGVIRAGIPLAEVEETTARLRFMLALAAALGLTIAVLMSAIASELMSRALRTLVAGARAVARGEQDGRIEFTSQDELGRLAGSFNRITEELNQTVADLGAERDRLQTILERMHDGVIALDADDRITLANSAAGRMVRIRESDIGRQLLEVVRAPELVEIVERSQQGIAGAAEFGVQGARERVIFAHAAPLRQVGGTVIVLHDVTEVRRLETVRRDFVANVSHELRTPVSVIRANAETLLTGALDDQQRAPAFVGAIHRNAERLSNLIADLLDLSRIEAGALKTNLGPIMVHEAVGAAVDAQRSRAEKRGIHLHLEVTDNLAVRADRIALSQILQNLLDNAIKFSQDSGDVRVRAMTDEEEEETVRIEVEDDGPGIAPAHRKRVFERFYRVDAGRSRDLGGTGLGLAIVKHLADSMGGRVGVSPAPDRGSVFWVELPREVPTVRPKPAAGDESEDSEASQEVGAAVKR
jgi:two-component system phosphate regulon sensor histidine kinase PhoR